MARRKELTEAKIRDLEARAETYSVPVDGLPLHVVVSPKGKKSYRVKFRIYPPAPSEYAPRPSPKQVEYVFPDSHVISLETAKERTRQLIESGKQGIDHREVWRIEKDELARKMKTIQADYNGYADAENPEFLKTAWDNYAATKSGVGRRHKLNIKRLWKHAEAGFGASKRTKDLTVSDVGKVKAALADTPQEFNKFRQTLFAVLELEVLEERISRNILRSKNKLTAPNPVKYRQTTLTEKGIQDFKEFYGNPENFDDIERNHARFLICILMTGQRPGMLRSLRREDDGVGNYLNLESGAMVFRKHKTAAKTTSTAETVFASEGALEIMRAAMRDSPDSPYVFGNIKAYKQEPLSEKRTEIVFRNYADKFETNSAEKLTTYSLRHTFGSTLARKNVHISMIKDQMLHSSVITTQQYIKTTEESRRQLAKSLDDLI